MARLLSLPAILRAAGFTRPPFPEGCGAKGLEMQSTKFRIAPRTFRRLACL